jgi:hypothetical protein
LGALIVILMLASFVGSFFVARHLGHQKNRTLWWLYWLFLGWIGVIILACVSPSQPQIPAGYVPVGYVPAGQVPAGYVPAGQVPAGYVPAGFVPAGQTAIQAAAAVQADAGVTS